MDTGLVIHMMVEKKYPLSQDTLSKMLSRRLEVDHQSEMGYELIRVILLLSYLYSNWRIRSQYLTVELADKTMKYPKGIAENVLAGIGKFVFPIDFIILDMPKDVKVPFILGRQFLSTTHAKIDVFKRKITLRIVNEKIIFKSVKHASSLIKRVYMLSLRERMEVDLEARLMGETLLRRDQVDDLMPTIEEGEVIDEPMIDIIKTRNNESFDEWLHEIQDMGDIILGRTICQRLHISVEAKKRNLGDTLRRKGCDDSFLRWSMLRRNPSGMLHRKVPWALHFGAFLI
ncbi:hypothetical protein Tco_0221460 [Tanacetum coccineum]